MRTSPTSVSKVEEVLAPHRKARWLWVGLLSVLLTVYSVSFAACGTAPGAGPGAPASMPDEISVDEAHQKYQDGIFLSQAALSRAWRTSALLIISEASPSFIARTSAKSSITPANRS